MISLLPRDRFGKQPAVWWLFFFLFVNLFFDVWGDTNANSRLAVLFAIAEEHTFRIDHYRKMTIDWAKTPDGHYYSNKPPGPMLLALPLYWIWDKIFVASPVRAERDAFRAKHAHALLRALSILFQVIPFLLLSGYALRRLEASGVSAIAIHVCAAAMLFGNTASLFMNSFCGHGLAAAFVLACCILLTRERVAWAALCLGWAMLSDYSAAVLVPPFVFVTLACARRRFKELAHLTIGAALPAFIWVVYHSLYFGGLFNLPNKYQNPLFVETTENALWGIFGLPRLSIIAQLLFGPIRGVLWTQGWLLILVVGTWFLKTRQPQIKLLTRFLFSSFILLLLMNSAFNNWHGGGTPGPRYLSSVFPAFGWLLGLYYDRFSSWLSIPIRLFVVASCAFSIFIFATHRILTSETMPVWGFYLQFIRENPVLTTWLRIIVMSIGFLALMRRWFGRPLGATQK
jgi:hypothetical protein